MIRETTAALSAAASCAQLAGHIAQLLDTAKANKKEYQSLLRAIRCIKGFLDTLHPASITTEGNVVLGELESVLQSAKHWVGKVSNTGPLLSLLRANTIRDEFLRVNRDLTSTFSILAAGEKLLDISAARSQLDQIQVELRSSKSEFFIQQAQASSKLKDVAVAAREGRWPEELLQRRLLDQLRQVPEVAALQPEELLTEFRALQLMAMYNGQHEADDDVAAAAQADKGKKGNMDADLEEFLVQQLCATLAPTVASTTNASLNHEAAASPPADYLCPISREIMVKPVMLVATGHSYEEANIRQWLETHSTCPVTGSKLSSKQVFPNYSLQKAIQSWASGHGLRLPAPPTFTPLHRDQGTAAVVDEEMGLGSGPAGMQQLHHHQQQQQKEPPLPPQQQQQRKAPGPGIPQFNAPGSGRYLRCTRTKWALGLIAIVLVVSGLATGLGIYFGVSRAKRGGNSTTAAGPSPAIEQQASSSTPFLLLDGVSQDGLPYRLYSTRNVTWMYAEKFATHQSAEEFCRDAGGNLAYFNSASEAADVGTFLGATLANGTKYAYDNPSDFILWMGLMKSQSGIWTTTNRQDLGSYTNWAEEQPSNKSGQDCAVLGWYWSGSQAWYSYDCNRPNMALAALCRLPAPAPGATSYTPKPGRFPKAPEPANKAFELLPHSSSPFAFKLNSQRVVTIHDNQSTWHEASRFCAYNFQRPMFAVKDKDDLFQLNQALAKAMGISGNRELGTVWLGGYKSANNTQWAWQAKPAPQSRIANIAGLLNIDNFDDGKPPWNPGAPIRSSETYEKRLCLGLTVWSDVAGSAWINDDDCDGKKTVVCIGPS